MVVLGFVDDVHVTQDSGPLRPQAPGSNIVQDGCFDRPTTTPLNSYATFWNGSTMGAWQITLGSVDQVGRGLFSAPNSCDYVYVPPSIQTHHESSHNGSP